MPDRLTPEARSELMAKVKSKDTAIERKFASGIGLPFRRGTKEERNADFVFEEARVAVFVDGDFWHGREIKDSLPDRWKVKLAKNKARDEVNRAWLRSEGWLVLSCWGSDLKRDPEAFFRIVREAVASGELKR